MQSEDLDFAFDEMPDGPSMDLVDSFLNFSNEGIQKPKEEIPTKPGFLHQQDDINDWENYFQTNGPKKETMKTKPLEVQIKSFNNEGLFKILEPREKGFIEVSDFKRKDYLKIIKGTKEQTSELNINLKTLTKTMLKEETHFMRLSKDEEQQINHFQTGNANFKAFRDLFGVTEGSNQPNGIQSVNQGKTDKKKLIVKKKADRLRRICLSKYSSSELIKEMHRGKMNQFNKFTLLKFVEQIRMSCISPENFTNWKSSKK